MYNIYIIISLILLKIMETLVKIDKTEENWILIFAFEWELDETNVDSTFKWIYADLWDFSEKKVIFNMAWLTYINSKSIGYIADIYSNLEDNKWKMYISNCSVWVKDILDLVWITQIVPTVDTIEDAVSAMS